MVKREILWNSKINQYTLDKEIDKIKSIKKIPVKYKSEDKTSKYRKEILKSQIFKEV